MALKFKDKNVLIFGLGILGGGLSVTNWMVKQGARVTVTDLKDATQLNDSIEKIEGPVTLKLGGHSKEMIEENDVIVVNPDVSINNEYIQYAFELGKEVTNEAILFFQHFDKPIIGVTGTRGKTTTTAWTDYLLNSPFLRSSIAGNSTSHPYLTVLERKDDLDIAVAEVPSFQLELVEKVPIAPDIAIITNISQDHLNRHGNMKTYAEVKAAWFKYQTPEQHCILNADDEWAYFLLSQNTPAQKWYFSLNTLPPDRYGIWHTKDHIHFQHPLDFARGKPGRVSHHVLTMDDDALSLGDHNISNLLAAVLAAHLAGVGWDDIQAKLTSLPQVAFRQEVVFKNSRLTVINDTTATSPEGAIQALKRFGGEETILITGGTDRELDFSKWADEFKGYIHPHNTVFLGGSATSKMRAALGDYVADVPVLDTLAECLAVSLEKSSKYKRAVVLFSPASKSFEKFKNEFDRGQQFNDLVQRYLSHK